METVYIGDARDDESKNGRKVSYSHSSPTITNNNPFLQQRNQSVENGRNQTLSPCYSHQPTNHQPLSPLNQPNRMSSEVNDLSVAPPPKVTTMARFVLYTARHHPVETNKLRSFFQLSGCIYSEHNSDDPGKHECRFYQDSER